MLRIRNHCSYKTNSVDVVTDAAVWFLVLLRCNRSVTISLLQLLLVVVVVIASTPLATTATGTNGSPLPKSIRTTTSPSSLSLSSLSSSSSLSEPRIVGPIWPSTVATSTRTTTTVAWISLPPPPPPPPRARRPQSPLSQRSLKNRHATTFQSVPAVTPLTQHFNSRGVPTFVTTTPFKNKNKNKKKKTNTTNNNNNKNRYYSKLPTTLSMSSTPWSAVDAGASPTTRRTIPPTRMDAPLRLSEKIHRTYTNKTVLITGATGGLGQALAMQLIHWKVARLILSGRTQTALDAVAQKCQSLDPTIPIEYILCDLANGDNVQQAITQFLEGGQGGGETATATTTTTNSRRGTIDILINNGGVSSRSRFVDTDRTVDARIMQINFLSGATLAKAVVPGMLAQGGGRILWISSVQGLMGIPHRSSYAASKFAVQGYTESIRSELYTSNIHVHTISPGYIRTNLSQRAITGDGTLYGQTDATTAAGADPQQVATELLTRVANGEMDFTIATTFSSWFATILRFLCPSLLRFLLVKRYEKSLISHHNTNENKNKED